jgi:phosphohistidine phosphatase
LAGVQEIWASPLVRAQQTAQIAQRALLESGNNIAIKTVDFLVPEATPDLLFAPLANTSLNSILLVSHQPFVGELLDSLCGSEPGFHPFDTSTIACVDCETAAAGMGTLRWLRHVHG